MALVEIIMPKMGESVMEGTILKWLKSVGETVEQDEPLLEIATDKVDTEVPSTHSGVITELLAQEGDVVQVGQPIAILDDQGADGSNTGSSTTTNTLAATAAAIETEVAQAVSTVSTHNNGSERPADNRFYSPLVMSIAQAENISAAELANIAGSGNGQRVTKKDILAYLANRQQPQTTPASVAAPAQPANTQPIRPTPSPQVAPSVSLQGNIEIVEMDRMRKIIAQRMVESKQISPHVTTFVEADVTNIVLWRNKVKDAFKKREGENITFTPIFLEAIAKAIKDFPMINASVDGDRIIIRKDINIGMAVATADGNLIVPVLHGADQYSLLGLSKRVNDLAARGRVGKLKADELSGGTYTMSNIGGFGNEMGTPILVQPQVAIMAFGAIKKKPAVIETPTGDVIGIRHMMYLSHAYDHRIVDGALGGQFVRRVADYLEAFDINREI